MSTLPNSEGVSVYYSAARYAAYNALAIAWYGHYNVGCWTARYFLADVWRKIVLSGSTTGNVGTSSFLYSQCDTLCKQGYTSSNGAEFVRGERYDSNQASGLDFVIGYFAGTRWNIKNCCFAELVRRI